jgi:hypothetical protein
MLSTSIDVSKPRQAGRRSSLATDFLFPQAILRTSSLAVNVLGVKSAVRGLRNCLRTRQTDVDSLVVASCFHVGGFVCSFPSVYAALRAEAYSRYFDRL